jgi:ABC-type uncharacterized transport system substrate-binding protein
MHDKKVEAVHKLMRTIPIVFVQVSAPVERGLVASMARPGGNMTGFANFEPSMRGLVASMARPGGNMTGFANFEPSMGGK